MAMKRNSVIAYSFGVVILLGILKPFLDVFSLNIGSPFLGSIAGIIFIASLGLISLLGGRPKLYKNEICLYLILGIALLQIFNPYGSILRGLSSFVSFYLAPLLVFYVSNRLLERKKDFESICNCLYYFAIISLLYGIYTSIFGVPDPFAFPDGEYYTGNGILRVRSITGSEQTFSILVFCSLIVSYPEHKLKFFLLLALTVIQVYFYFPKNPAIFLLLAIIYGYFLSGYYKLCYMLIYLVFISLVFLFFIYLTIIGDGIPLDSWLTITPFGALSVVERYDKWLINGFQIILHPLGFGTGSASKLLTSDRYDDTTGFMSLTDQIFIQEPHSEYLRLVLESSIISLIIFIVFLNQIFLRLRSLIDNNDSIYIKGVAGIIFAFTFISFFNNHIFGSEEKYIFWFFVGLILNRNNIFVKYSWR
jgi:hypothetical protein